MRALVLRKRPFSETDLIIDFLVEGEGLRSGFAAGALRSKRRYPHQFHILGLYDLSWAKKSNSSELRRLESCELVKVYSSIGSDLNRLTRWNIVQEWLLQKDLEIISFERVLNVLESLMGAKGLQAFHRFFIEEISSQGWSPELDLCGVCQTSVASADQKFSMSHGGVIHSRCGAGKGFSEASRDFFQSVLQNERKDFALAAETSNELDEICIPFLEHQLSKRLNSFEFLQRIRAKMSCEQLLTM